MNVFSHTEASLIHPWALSPELAVPFSLDGLGGESSPQFANSARRHAQKKEETTVQPLHGHNTGKLSQCANLGACRSGLQAWRKRFFKPLTSLAKG